MKTGAGDDPFADDVDEDEEETADPEPIVRDESETDDIVGEPPHAGRDSGRTPWVYTRENVKEGRSMVQFFLRDFVQSAEDDFVDAVADELGTDVTTTDVREAAYVAAMRDPEIVAAELERWGFEPDRE